MNKFLLSLLTLVSITLVSAAQSPYSGQEQRAIKSLSAEQIEGILAGSGMGYAKTAELNSYPGPKHVLELATELGLSDEQLAQTNEIFKSMQLQAMALGRQLVDKEKRLDQMFANNTITDENLKKLLAEIADVQGQIRHAHLAAHIQQRAVLSEHQARQYDRLRGYAGGHDQHGH